MNNITPDNIYLFPIYINRNHETPITIASKPVIPPVRLLQQTLCDPEIDPVIDDRNTSNCQKCSYYVFEEKYTTKT